MHLPTLIDTYTSTHEQRGDTHHVYRGGTFQDLYGFSQEVPESFEEVEEWGDGQYRAVWVSHPDLATITYVEGDVIVTVHAVEASWIEELAYATTFYEEH